MAIVSGVPNFRIFTVATFCEKVQSLCRSHTISGDSKDFVKRKYNVEVQI